MLGWSWVISGNRPLNFFREGGAPESVYRPPEARGLRKTLGFFKQLGKVREGLGFFWKFESFRKFFEQTS